MGRRYRPCPFVLKARSSATLGNEVNASRFFPRLARAAMRPDGVALVCLPFAGGAATAYRDWERRVPPGIEPLPVELPGRGTRFSEPAFRDLPSLVEALGEAVLEALPPPRKIALFGHSMGAAVAVESARWLVREGCSPVAVVVSGRAPQRPTPPLHRASDADLVAALRAFGGTPEAVLASGELLRLMLPVLRADFEVVATHNLSPDPPLDVPLLALGGADDPAMTPEDGSRWRAFTARAFAERTFPGGHFYFGTSDAPLAALGAFVLEHASRE
jgi:medium-chain acyl-[acyl-carrier-protein] hydrolase